MNIAIVGSRHYPDLRLVRKFVRRLPRGTTVVSGGAIGVDAMAERTARDGGYGVDVYLPDWERHGKSAGLKRNALVADAADEVIAFWDGKSRGTISTCNHALHMVKRVTLVLPDGSAHIFEPDLTREHGTLDAEANFKVFVKKVQSVVAGEAA